MTDPVISVEGLAKQYRLGEMGWRTETFREMLARVVTAPLRGGNGDESIARDSIWALRDVSFNVRAGEVVGIVGRNGAGKSTLLKILSQITAPTCGRARIQGRVSSLLEVGTGFHPELTGRENIFLNAAILGMTRRETRERFDEIVAFAEVERFLETPVKRYSTGMYVRLAFAVAAHMDPEVLIVDEVLAVGDAAFQRKCLGKMRQTASGGRTVLFVSHNLAAVRALCDRGLFLADGRLEVDDTANAAVDSYLSRTISSAMNAQQAFPIFDESRALGIEECIANVAVTDGGQTLIVRLVLRSERVQEGVGVGLRLTSTDGAPVSVLTPMTTRFALDLDQGRRWCTIRVDNIDASVAGGDYVLGVWLAAPSGEAILAVDEAAVVRIQGKDVYDSGVAFDARMFGLVPLRARFAVSGRPQIEGDLPDQG